MDSGFYTISLTARNMRSAWVWYKPWFFFPYWHRLSFYTGSILGYVTDGKGLFLEVRFPITVYKDAAARQKAYRESSEH